MPYRFHPDEELPDAVRRIAHEQLDRARDEIAAARHDPEIAVHALRRRCKKIRSLLRLVRPALGTQAFRKENGRWRDLAAEFSATRDATILRQCTKTMLAGNHGTSDEVHLRAVHRILQRALAPASADELRRRLQVAVRRLEAARASIPTWPADDLAWPDLICGLRRTYRRARRAMRSAQEDPGDTALHEWRKRAKALGHHARLLRCLAPPWLQAFEAELSRLGHELGDDHDLAVWVASVTGRPRAQLPAPPRRTARRLAAGRRNTLQEQAFARGGWLFAEKPNRFLRLLESCRRIR
jgi:hypothetical protein